MKNLFRSSIINNFDENLNYKNRSDLHFETKTPLKVAHHENFESIVENEPTLL